MRPRPAVAALLLAALPAGALAAQNSDKPSQGKIDAVEREAHRAERDGGSAFFLLDLAGDFLGFLAHTPTEPGQGYQRYPWSEPGDDEPFVRHDVMEGRRFHTLSLAAFDDVASTLRAGVFSFEATNAIGQLNIEYAQFVEPLAGETDRLHLVRVGVAALPPLGRRGFLRVGGAFRGLILDDGNAAGGPELELGAQVFPARPWGLAMTLRGAWLAWDAGASTPMAENVTTGSVFVGRVEIQGGWRWTKIQRVPAFGGPTLGLRVWF